MPEKNKQTSASDTKPEKTDVPPSVQIEKEEQTENPKQIRPEWVPRAYREVL